MNRANGTMSQGLVFILSESQKEKRKSGVQKTFEETAAENIPILVKDTHLELQEGQ